LQIAAIYKNLFRSANPLNGCVQVDKAASRAIEYDLFLFIDPTNHIKSLGEQASRFVRLKHG